MSWKNAEDMVKMAGKKFNGSDNLISRLKQMCYYGFVSSLFLILVSGKLKKTAILLTQFGLATGGPLILSCVFIFKLCLGATGNVGNHINNSDHSV